MQLFWCPHLYMAMILGIQFILVCFPRHSLQNSGFTALCFMGRKSISVDLVYAQGEVEAGG